MTDSTVDGDTTTRLSLEDSVGFRLSRLVRVRRERWAAELRSLGVTPPQAAVLRAIKDRPDHSLRALSRTLEIDVMSVKRCVDELQARGWVVTAARDDDRRVRVVNLVQAGEVLLARLDELAILQEGKLRDQLSHPQFELLSAVLDQLERAEGIGVDSEMPNGKASEEHR